MSKEAMQMALDALQDAKASYWTQKLQNTIEALRAALAQPEPEPEPVACDNSNEVLSKALWCDLKTDKQRSAWLLLGRGYETGVIAKEIQNDLAMVYHKLSSYTAPPQRKPLSKEKIEAISEASVTNCYFDTITFARAIEAAHGIGEVK